MALTDFGNRSNFERSLALHYVFFRVWQFGTLRSYGINSDRKSYRRNQRERERATKKAYDAYKNDPLLKPEDD